MVASVMLRADPAVVSYVPDRGTRMRRALLRHRASNGSQIKQPRTRIDTAHYQQVAARREEYLRTKPSSQSDVKC